MTLPTLYIVIEVMPSDAINAKGSLFVSHKFLLQMLWVHYLCVFVTDAKGSIFGCFVFVIDAKGSLFICSVFVISAKGPFLYVVFLLKVQRVHFWCCAFVTDAHCALFICRVFVTDAHSTLFLMSCFCYRCPQYIIFDVVFLLQMPTVHYFWCHVFVTVAHSTFVFVTDAHSTLFLMSCFCYRCPQYIIYM